MTEVFRESYFKNMLEDERRNNFTLRVSVDNLKEMIRLCEEGVPVSQELVAKCKTDIDIVLDSITNYHSRFKEVLETINHIRDLNLPTSLDDKN